MKDFVFSKFDYLAPGIFKGFYEKNRRLFLCYVHYFVSVGYSL